MNTYANEIRALIEAGNGRDQVIITLVSEHGLSLNTAQDRWTTYARENGLTKAIVSRKAEALAWLSEQWDGYTVEPAAVQDAVVDLSEKFGVAESTARDYIKAYFKDLGQPVPAVDPRQQIFDWFKEQGDTADKDEFIDFAVNVVGRSRSNANEYWKGYELHLYLVN